VDKVIRKLKFDLLAFQVNIQVDYIQPKSADFPEKTCCTVTINNVLVMVALWNRADHYIFILSFVLLLSSSCFFPHLISAATDWMSAILPHMVWP